MREQHIEYHRNGRVRARGDMLDGELDGYWEWFRVDGAKLRSGYFSRDVQVGEWITYDQRGEVYKVVQMDKKTKPLADEAGVERES